MHRVANSLPNPFLSGSGSEELPCRILGSPAREHLDSSDLQCQEVFVAAREECEAEHAQHRELEECQAEEAHAEAEARNNEIWSCLGDIQNSLQDRADADRIG